MKKGLLSAIFVYLLTSQPAFSAPLKATIEQDVELPMTGAVDRSAPVQMVAGSRFDERMLPNLGAQAAGWRRIGWQGRPFGGRGQQAVQLWVSQNWATSVEESRGERSSSYAIYSAISAPSITQLGVLCEDAQVTKIEVKDGVIRKISCGPEQISFISRGPGRLEMRHIYEKALLGLSPDVGVEFFAGSAPAPVELPTSQFGSSLIGEHASDALVRSILSR